MAELKVCKKCGKISSWNSYFNGYICECGNIERKTITNADRIRAKSDEELAEWIGNFVIGCMKDAGIEAKLDETFVPDLVEFFKLPVEEVNND